MAPLIIKSVEPDLRVCPPSQMGLTVVQVTVSAEGTASDARIYKSVSPCWDRAVLDAVRRFEFCPGERNGKAADVELFISVRPHIR